MQCGISLGLNHRTASPSGSSSFSFGWISGGGSCQAPCGARHYDTIGMVCLIRYAQNLAFTKGGRFCDLLITCTSYAHHQQPISVAIAGDVVGSMLASHSLSAIKILSLKNWRIAALSTITTAQVIFSSDLRGDNLKASSMVRMMGSAQKRSNENLLAYRHNALRPCQERIQQRISVGAPAFASFVLPSRALNTVRHRTALHS